MLSHLQQFILEECAARGGSISRQILDTNYSPSSSRSSAVNYKKVITQSIERLIDRGLAVGYGIKTKEKLFIQRVRLTPQGRAMVQKMRSRKQLNLPLNKHARNKN